MALAGTNAPVPLLLAYCVTGLALWTIDAGIVGLRTEAVFSNGQGAVVTEERRRLAKLENYAKPLLGRSGQAAFLLSPGTAGVEAPSSSDALAKTEEMREQHRRTVMALMVMALLEGPNVKSD
jgi:hypothetical protein